MRVCTECKVEKPLTDFWPDRSKKHGYCAKCKPCNAAKARAYRITKGYGKIVYARNKESERERHLVRKYGVTLADYARMYQEQQGCCAICKKSQERALDVDHCHTTGRVRGLLCTNCNRMIGHAAGDAGRLRRAAEYLNVSV